MKFLAATFPGNERAKICKSFRQIFAAFFARVGKHFRLNFALRKFLHKILVLAIRERPEISEDKIPTKRLVLKRCQGRNYLKSQSASEITTKSPLNVEILRRVEIPADIALIRIAAIWASKPPWLTESCHAWLRVLPSAPYELHFEFLWKFGRHHAMVPNSNSEFLGISPGIS